jgi:hypothetical protein
MHHNLGPSRREFFAPEFFLVVLLAFGLFSVASIRALFGPLTGARGAPLRRPAGMDAARLPAERRPGDHLHPVGTRLEVARLLREDHAARRPAGIRPRDGGVHADPRGAGADGVVAQAHSPALAVVPAATGVVPIAGMLAAAIVKAVFEEVLVCAYVVQSLRGKFGIALAVNASIALRLSFHLYQGPGAFLAFAVLGLVFTFFYIRTGPPLAAHRRARGPRSDRAPRVISFVGPALHRLSRDVR